MSLFNHKIMVAVAGVCLCGIAVNANAQSCWFLGYDVLRTEEFSVTVGGRTSWRNSEDEKATAKKKELNIQEMKKGFKKKQLLSSPSYDYMSGANCSQMGSQEYLPAASSVDDAKTSIKDKFFVKPQLTQITKDQIDDVVRRRHNYLQELGQEVLSLSYGYRSSISEELETLSKAPTEAKGNIQQIELMAQTKKTMVEEKAAELLFQAKLMELEAAQMLLGTSYQYINDPSSSSGETK